MSYLYHRVPANMSGTTLYPLNALRSVDPEAYEFHVQKYMGREKLMNERIPQLECLWNDVLFMSAVPPQDFCTAYHGAGFPRRRPMHFYRIDPQALDESNFMVLTRMGIDEPRGYAPFKHADLPSYASIPRETCAYWEGERIKKNDRPFLWMHIPHILYRGSINVTYLEIVAG